MKIVTSITEAWAILRDAASKKEDYREALRFVLSENNRIQARNDLAEPILGVMERIANEAADAVQRNLEDR